MTSEDDATRGTLGVGTPDRATFAVDPEAPAAPAARLVRPDAAVSLALIVLMNSPQHRHLFLAELEWVLFPPILRSQYKIYLQGTRPVAFAAWAHVTEEVERRLEAGETRLTPEEWSGGDRTWLIHLVAPFGGREKLVEDLLKTALTGRAVRVSGAEEQGAESGDRKREP